MQKLYFIFFVMTLHLGLMTFAPSLMAQTPSEVATENSKIISRWLIQSTGHYDYQSATTVNPKSPGKNFFKIPKLLTASDYGFSYTQATASTEVKDTLDTMSSTGPSLDPTSTFGRFHLNLGFANQYDLNLSYLFTSNQDIRGWGAGIKKVIFKWNRLFLSYRFNYARSEKEDFFDSHSNSHDLSLSFHHFLVDAYFGVRRWSGNVNFSSSIASIDPGSFDVTPGQLQTYFGVILATTTHTRLCLESSSVEDNTQIGAKFSFHFESLLPTRENWFSDPRNIRR